MEFTPDDRSFFEARELCARVLRPEHPTLKGLVVEPLDAEKEPYFYLDQILDASDPDPIKNFADRWGFLALLGHRLPEDEALRRKRNFSETQRSEGRALLFHQEELLGSVVMHHGAEKHIFNSNYSIARRNGRSIFCFHMPPQDYQPLSPTVLIRRDMLPPLARDHFSMVIETQGESIRMKIEHWNLIKEIVIQCRDAISACLEEKEPDQRRIASELSKLAYLTEGIITSYNKTGWIFVDRLLGVGTDWYKASVYQHRPQPDVSLVWRDGSVYHGKRSIRREGDQHPFDFSHRVQRIYFAHPAQPIE